MDMTATIPSPLQTRISAASSTASLRLRLLAVSSRIDQTWPAQPSRASKLFGRGGLSEQKQAIIRSLLFRMPTPLPLVIDGRPDYIIAPEDADLREAERRAVDAAFALLSQEEGVEVYDAYVAVVDDSDPSGPVWVGIAKPEISLLAGIMLDNLDKIGRCLSDPE